MKLRLVMALCAMLAFVTLPGIAQARFFGGFHSGFHSFGGGFHSGFHTFHGGFFRGFGVGFWPGYYPAYYYNPCWRWVSWPYWHRVWVCY